MNKYAKLFLSVIGCELVGLSATPFTIASIPTWYAQLNKPPFSPPNWVFGPVWTLLYFLMGVSVWLIWTHKKQTKEVKKGLKVFGIQLALNFFWSILFFGLHLPIVALIEIITLWTAILVTIIQFYKVNKIAAYLLIPYLLWVSFASILNFAIVVLN